MQPVRLAFFDEQRAIHREDTDVACVHIVAFLYHHGTTVGIGRLHAVAVDMEQDVCFAQLRCIVNVALPTVCFKAVCSNTGSNRILGIWQG